MMKACLPSGSTVKKVRPQKTEDWAKIEKLRTGLEKGRTPEEFHTLNVAVKIVKRPSLTNPEEIEALYREIRKPNPAKYE